MTNPKIYETENEVLRNRLKRIKATMRKLVRAVEQYVEPEKGDAYMHRSELLKIKNEAKNEL